MAADPKKIECMIDWLGIQNLNPNMHCYIEDVGNIRIDSRQIFHVFESACITYFISNFEIRTFIFLIKMSSMNSINWLYNFIYKTNQNSSDFYSSLSNKFS